MVRSWSYGIEGTKSTTYASPDTRAVIDVSIETEMIKATWYSRNVPLGIL
jgi:hypothetical protein